MGGSTTAAAPPAGTPLVTAVAAVAEQLAAAGVPGAAADSRWLVAHATGHDPKRRPDAVLPAAAVPVLAELVARRSAREPLQLIVGHTGFRLLEILCRPGVFIPRPESEVVAGAAVAAARACEPSPLVVEPCTGSGAIACAIASEVAGATILATDRDTTAVALARDNVRRLVAGQAGVPGPACGATVEVHHGDLLAPLPQTLRGEVDVLVANPPYLPAGDQGAWAPEVAEHDPVDALVGGRDGHEVVDRLLALAAQWLRPGGTVIVEIDDRRGAQACQAAATAGLVEVGLIADLTGRHRAVLAHRRAAHG